MRELKKVSLDGKGGDIVRLDGKGGDIIYEHKYMDAEYLAKPVPANYEESSIYTKPRSMYGSREGDPYEYSFKSRETTKYTRPGEEPEVFAHKARAWPSRYTKPGEEPDEYLHKARPAPSRFTKPGEELDEFTWKFGEWPARWRRGLR